MKLKDILADIGPGALGPAGEKDVSGIAYDTRRLAPGDLFVAVPGFRADGHDFVVAAAAAGAVAALVERAVPGVDLPQIIVPSARNALAASAAAFYGYPARELNVIGVTGTKGKTTTCYLLDHILKATGFRTAFATTVANEVVGRAYPARLTTAEAPELQRLLRDAVDAGARWAAVEVSSHALALRRVATIPFRGAVFTNLSHDHLDFHGNLGGYFLTKAALFEQLAPGAPAVINGDDVYGRRLGEHVRPPVITFGLGTFGNDYRAEDVASGWAGSTFTLRGPGGDRWEVTTRLPGEINVYNVLAAAATALEMGVDAAAVRDGVASLAGVPGRLELLSFGDRLQVVIDYAHTPDSMEKALTEVKRLGVDYTVVVFGATGDRDREKRPVMAGIAARFADYVIITTDDPYYEDPAAIAAQVETGLKESGVPYDVILDRAAAIKRALGVATPERRTVVAVLGKGHEKVQKITGEEVPFDDHDVVRAAAAEMGLAPARAPEPPPAPTVAPPRAAAPPTAWEPAAPEVKPVGREYNGARAKVTAYGPNVAIDARRLYKSFGAKQVLTGLDLQIYEAETLVIIGRSGCGKSVFLKHVMGLIRPDDGEIWVDGREITATRGRELNDIRRRFGMVFQGAALFDSLTVGENVGFFLYEYSDLSRERITEIVREKLLMVGLEGIENLRPAELSGGMKKRVGLARAIAHDPSIVLYDEPTTGIDPIMADVINDLIIKLDEQLGVTSVVVTHDMVSAYKIADRIAMMYGGRIVALGTPDEIRTSDNPYVQQFIHGSAEGPIDVIGGA